MNKILSCFSVLFAGIIGGLLGLGIWLVVNGGNAYFWGALSVVLNPIVALATLIGIMTALRQFVLARQVYSDSLVIRQENLKSKQAGLTKEAIAYYMSDVKGSLQYTIDRYSAGYADPNKLFKVVISESNLRAVIVKLDYLGIYLGSIVEDDLISAIADDVTQLLQLPEIDKALAIFDETSKRKKYQQILTLIRGVMTVESMV